jgi:hypothetical protein
MRWFAGLGLTAATALFLAPPLGARTDPAPDPAPQPQGQTPPPATAPAPAAERPWYQRIGVSGLVFGDAYAVVDHHDPELEDQNGFWIRRIYLTFDFDVAENWTARLRMEANGPGDFETSGKLEPFVKDAWLAWQGDDHSVLMGISPSPTFDFIEGFWGYRAVEKTPLDLYRMGSSRDFGVAAKGNLAGNRVFYHAMLGNGAGESSETNEGKKAMLAVGVRATDALVFELYADTEDRPDSADRTTYQGFLGWKGERCRVGLQYAHQERQLEGGPDEPLAVGSLFGVVDLSSRLTLLLRYDRSFDGNPEAGKIPYFRFADDTEFDLALAGLDWALAKKIRLIPNVEYVSYRETAGRAAPDDDLIARLTLFFSF